MGAAATKLRAQGTPEAAARFGPGRDRSRCQAGEPGDPARPSGSGKTTY
jgi:hypothetical protein